MLAQNEDFIKPSAHPYYVKRICWKAIFAGALVGFGLTFLLKIFDRAIGISVFSADSSGAEAIVFGGFLGSLVGIIASMFFSGWIASYLSRPLFFDRRIGALYGLLVWCLALLISFVFIYHVAFRGMEVRDHLTNPASGVVGLNTSQTASVITDEASDRSTVSPNVASGNTPAKAGLSLFLTFLLYFVGAVSASFGGYCGLKADRRDSNKQEVV